MTTNGNNEAVHAALNPTPTKRASKKAAAPSLSVVESPAERTARMKAIAESTDTTTTVRTAAAERKAMAKTATEATKQEAEGRHAAKMGTIATTKPTAKKAAPAKKAAKRSTRPEADESKIKALIPKLVAADKIGDKDNAIAARTKLVDEMLDAGATWTAIADTRKVSMSTARGQHRRAGGRMTR